MTILKYKVTCYVCGEKIPAGIDSPKDKSGHRHPNCQSEPLCIICDDSVGCAICEFYKTCDRKDIKRCLCQDCTNNPLIGALYAKAVEKTFPILTKIPIIVNKTDKTDKKNTVEFIELFQTDYTAISKKTDQKDPNEKQDLDKKEKTKSTDSKTIKKPKHAQSSLFDAF